MKLRGWRCFFGGERGHVLAVALLVCTYVLALGLSRLPSRYLRITVLDVGQADSIVVQTPAGHVLLIDGGGRLERGSQFTGNSSAEQVGKRIVVPFLLRRGIHSVDAIIGTHPHGDHFGGIPVVLRMLHVGMLADSRQRYGGMAYNDAIATAREEHVPIVFPRAGTVWKSSDGVTLYFIGPQLPLLKNTGNDINDNSITFVLQYKHFRMLFTGDAGFAAEQRFLAFAKRNGRKFGGLHADILKVGHHGSAYSSSLAFLAAVRPHYAIISVGRHNHFGHPAPRTLAALSHIGANVYRTDRNAAVTIVTDGTHISVTTLLSPMLQAKAHLGTAYRRGLLR